MQIPPGGDEDSMLRDQWADTIRRTIVDKARIRFSAKAHDPYQFRRSYQAQMALFREWVRLDSEQSVIAGACAVYGWMPTMLKSVGEPHQQFCGLASRVLSLPLASAVAELEMFSSNERALLLRHVNRSTVGTSKFLHFLSNGTLPIWDSRVAHTLGLRSGRENPDRYITYAAAMSDVLEAPDLIPNNLRDFVEEEGAVTNTRIVEFGLYISR